MQTKLTLSLQRRFRVSPAVIYRAWTTGADTMRWCECPGAEIVEDVPDARVGGTWRTVMRDVATGKRGELRGKYREVVVARKLVFTFGSDDPSLDNVCSVEFTEEDGGTLMRFTQEPFFDESVRAAHAAGWNRSFDNLERLVAGQARARTVAR